jgi:hypothetical protein
MVEIASDRPLFKTILVEMAYSVIHLHNRINKSRVAVLLLCTSSVTKSIYKSLYSLGNWATYLGIQFEAETGCSSIFQNVPWCSIPTDSCGSNRINQVLYRQKGSRTFRDFPRGFHDLLQNVAQICTVYI